MLATRMARQMIWQKKDDWIRKLVDGCVIYVSGMQDRRRTRGQKIILDNVMMTLSRLDTQDLKDRDCKNFRSAFVYNGSRIPYGQKTPC